MVRLQQYPLRFEPEERAAWQAAADKVGLPLSQWIRAACNIAAKRTAATPSPTWEQVCPHPRHERTPYGVCRACGQKVDR